MKKIIVSAALAAALFTAFTESKEENRLARVNSVNGLLIFVDSEPTSPHKVLGEVSRSYSYGLGDDDYPADRDGLIKKAKKEFGTDADGLILRLNTNEKSFATVIKFE